MKATEGYGEFRRGWPIVLASMLGVGLGLSPLPFYTIGLLAPQLAREFGWGMGSIFFGITITTFVVFGSAPLAAYLATRYGVRRVAITSTVLFSLSFMAFGLSNGSLPLFYCTWAAVALFGAGTLPITWTRGVNAWFDARKGLALGLTLMGTGLFGIVAKPFTTWLIASFGWRGAYVGLGLLPLCIAAPAAYVFFRNTDGDPRKPARSDRPIDGQSFGEALRNWRFWLMIAAFIPISFALGGPIPNMENILKLGGFPIERIVQVTPFIGLSALLGRLVGGWLIDRFWAPGVGFVIVLLPSASCWLLAHGPLSYESALASIVLIGFAVGIEYDLMAFFVARYFGMRSYAAIYSMLYVSFAFGSGLAPAVFGWSVDRTGSYGSVLTVSFVLLVIGACCLLGLGRYRTVAAAVSPAIRPNVTAEQSPIAGR